MEYRKDKRTKNLTLRDIHVGDWVQVWSEQAERYSPPLKNSRLLALSRHKVMGRDIAQQDVVPNPVGQAVQVLAECTFPHHFLQVAVGG